MKKFTFSLHALLHLKQSQEKQERNALALLTRALAALEEERAETEARRSSAQQAYGESLVAGIRAPETRQYTDYFRMMKELASEQDRRIAEARAGVEACRARLVEVLREIHMLENLRDRQYQQYLAEVQAEEDKTIGDFVSYQSAQKTIE